jgi:ferredoxin
MLDAPAIKEYARQFGADVVGIASMDRFEGAPKQMDLRYAMPEAKSLIVMGFRIMRGSLRGVEEGTFFTNYSAMGYGFINYHVLPMTSRYLARVIEDEGYEAMPIGYHFNWASIKNTDGAERPSANGGPWSKPVREGLPAPDIFASVRIAAYLAGLGEIGYSKVFLNPVFGPRVRYAMVMTDLELEPDPIMKPGTLCNRCMACVRECPGQAISATETVKIKLGGYEVEWGKLSEWACRDAFVGAEKVADGEQGDYMAGSDQYKPSDVSPFYQKPYNIFGTGEAVCCGRGCVRACMINLEQRGVLENKFKQSFRRRPQWTIDWSDYEATRRYDPENKNERYQPMLPGEEFYAVKRVRNKSEPADKHEIDR